MSSPTRTTRTTRTQDVVERALELSRADGCVVIASEESSVNVRWAGNTLTTNGVGRSRELTVIATVGGSTGTAAGVVARSAVSLEEVEAVVRLAEDAARRNEAAEDAAPLAEPTDDNAAGWTEGPGETSASVLSGFAPALGEAFSRAAAQGRELFGYAEHDVSTTYLATSTGVRRRHEQPTGRVELTGKSHDRSRSSWVGAATRDFSDVDPLALDGELARRLAWAQRRVEAEPGRWTAVLPPSAVADLMIYLYWSAAARPAAEGRTVFSRRGGDTRVGDTLSSTPLDLRSDPTARGLECAPFVAAGASSDASSVFDNGLPVPATDWISGGVLTSLLQTRHSAQLTGLPFTPAVDNLELRSPAGAGSVDDLVSGVDRGLLLTCLWYIREVDPQTLLLTGLTRDGVYLVEHGEVVGEVTNFRFNESPVDLLSRVTQVGAATRTLPREWGDYFNRASMAALRVDGFNMSSTSDAL